MRLVPDKRIRGLILAAPLLVTIPCIPTGMADASSGLVTAATSAVDRVHAHNPPLGGRSAGNAAEAKQQTHSKETTGDFPGKFPEAFMALSGWPIPERALSSDQDATWHGALRDPARRHGGNEDAIQAGPFLIGSGVILLAVVLVFRGTLDADRRLERTRRSRLHRRLERSNEELAQRAREGEDRRALDAPEAEAEPEARPGPLV